MVHWCVLLNGLHSVSELNLLLPVLSLLFLNSPFLHLRLDQRLPILLLAKSEVVSVLVLERLKFLELNAIVFNALCEINSGQVASFHYLEGLLAKR